VARARPDQKEVLFQKNLGHVTFSGQFLQILTQGSLQWSTLRPVVHIEIRARGILVGLGARGGLIAEGKTIQSA